MAIQRMAVIDSNNLVVNVVLYDSEAATWLPPEGCRIIQSGLFGRGDAAPGGRWNGKMFTPGPASTTQSPSLEERVQTIEKRLNI